MKKYGRFEFKAAQPAEVYEGENMELDAKGFVRIFCDEPTKVMGVDATTQRLVVAIHLDKGQSVREITDGPANVRPFGASKRETQEAIDRANHRLSGH